MKALSGSRLFLVLISFVAIGCKENLVGEAHVVEPLKFNSSKQKIAVTVGNHPIKVQISDDGKIKVEFKDLNTEKKTKIEVKVENLSLPVEGGPIDIPAAQSGENYDVVGNFEITNAQTDIVEEYEPCYQSHAPGSCSYPGSDGCLDDRIKRSSRLVRYYEIVDTKNIELRLIDPVAVNVAAVVWAANSKSKRVYTYQGVCN